MVLEDIAGYSIEPLETIPYLQQGDEGCMMQSRHVVPVSASCLLCKLDIVFELGMIVLQPYVQP